MYKFTDGYSVTWKFSHWGNFHVFNAAESKAETKPSVVITVYIFDFSSEIAEWNSRNIDRKQDLNILYQVCVFQADRKTKMATRPPID